MTFARPLPIPLHRLFNFAVVLAVLAAFFLVALAEAVYGQETSPQATFEIKRFSIEGNTLYSDTYITASLLDFIGSDKTTKDIEKARDALEKLHHDAGYPTVVVNIPEQTLEDGTVRFQVIEGRIGKVRVTGNRYFTSERILKGLPSFEPGAILYIPDVQRDIGKLGSNPDLKVSPLLMPGREPGTIDAELKVEDKLPLHGSAELNNRYSANTTALRFNAILKYDNLWQRDHSATFQFQTAPQDTDEVQVLAGSYVLPAPWNDEQRIAFYGIWSDSATAFGEGFNVVGKGFILGMRYVLPLRPYHAYYHNLTVGLDYKDFDETTGYTTPGGEQTSTPLTYLPLSFSYSSSLQDSMGATQFSGGLNMVFRGLVTDEEQFAIKRYKATGDYLYATAGVERLQKLPADFGIFLKLDGQISDQPLVSNEQYAAGGMVSVRGYKESEVLGDDALHGMAEFLAPDLAALVGMGSRMKIIPYAFYDFAMLKILEPLPGQDENINIHATGVGIRGGVSKYFEYEVDLAVPLATASNTQKGDARILFLVKFQF